MPNRWDRIVDRTLLGANGELSLGKYLAEGGLTEVVKLETRQDKLN